MEQTCYKVFRKYRGKLRPLTAAGSLMMPSFPEGEWLQAPVGGFFLFDSADNARAFMEERAVYNRTQNWCIRPCLTRDYISDAHGICTSYRGDLKKMCWKPHTIGEIRHCWATSLLDTIFWRPRGMVCYREIKILEAA